jgi:CRISPR/Cas system CSM-associated protein Csm5 (group 7 of RAMP superfamily)
MELNYTYNLKLKVLTPLFIGSGKEKDWVKGFDFIVLNENLYIFNQNKLFNYLNNKKLLEEYVEIISKKQYKYYEIEKFFREHIGNNLEDIAEATYNNCSVTTSEIKSFIRDGMGNAYIPGSSIKGAIRSVLFNKLYNAHKNHIKNNDKNEYIKLALGDFDKSIMRYIRPYDVYEIDDFLSILDVKLYNVKDKDNKSPSQTKKIGITVECLYPFDDIKPFNFQLNIAEPFLEIIQNKYKANSSVPTYKDDVFKNSKEQTIHQLFNIINEYTYNHIQKEIEFFKKYTHVDYIEENIIKKLQEIQKSTINNKKSCVLRMSYGSGFHGITGDWMFDDHSIDDINKNERKRSVAKLNDEKTAKSRRIIDDEFLLGFVELILPDDIKDNPQPFSAKNENKPISIQKTDNTKFVINKQDNKSYTKNDQVKNNQPLNKYPVITKLSEIAKGKYVIAEITELGKPSHKVKIIIENKIFETILSNIKNRNLNIGDKVIAEIRDHKGTEKINSVAFGRFNLL